MSVSVCVFIYLFFCGCIFSPQKNYFSHFFVLFFNCKGIHVLLYVGKERCSVNKSLAMYFSTQSVCVYVGRVSDVCENKREKDREKREKDRERETERERQRKRRTERERKREDREREGQRERQKRETETEGHREEREGQRERGERD